MNMERWNRGGRSCGINSALQGRAGSFRVFRVFRALKSSKQFKAQNSTPLPNSHEAMTDEFQNLNGRVSTVPPVRLRDASLSSRRGRRGPERGGLSCLRLALVAAVLCPSPQPAPRSFLTGRGRKLLRVVLLSGTQPGSRSPQPLASHSGVE